MALDTEVSHYPVENTGWVQGLNDLELQGALSSKEENKQRHEKVSEMGLGRWKQRTLHQKNKLKATARQPIGLSPEHGSPQVANLSVFLEER